MNLNRNKICRRMLCKIENKKSKKLFFSIGMSLFMLSQILTGCGMLNQAKQYQTTGFAMGTVITQNMYGGNEEVAQEILAVIHNLEQTISWRIEGTDVDRINDAAGTGQAVSVNDRLAGWLKECSEVYDRSGGCLDVTVGPVARLWDIGGENPRVPEAEELAAAVHKVDSEKMIVDGNEVCFFTEEGQLDLGAVGKGIGCDEIFDYIVTNYPKLNGTFSVGGSVLIYGAKPNKQPWKIGIRDPRGAEGEYMGSLTLSLKEGEKINVSTSGDYEKYFEEDGIRYHHILDPKTGAPAESDLISVTIISESGFLTDALSTACFVAGKDAGLKLAKEFEAEAILITKDGEVCMTEEAAEWFDLINTDYEIK